MEIVIRLQIDENRVDNVEMLLDETADKIDEAFNIGNKYSACISAVISSDNSDMEVAINDGR